MSTVKLTEKDIVGELVKIPQGYFMMGSTECDDEEPVHRVSISYSLAIGKYPVTQKQWQAVMENNPSMFQGANKPVERVSWNDIQEFLQKLNHKLGLSDSNHCYRLPSEAEWEYAVRAGTTTAYYWGDDNSKNSVSQYAWYGGNSNDTTHDVGLKTPNPHGLYDMLGNVWEWVQDCNNDDYENAPVNGSAWEDGDCQHRVLRGGAWNFFPSGLRVSNRFNLKPHTRHSSCGFRLAKTLTS